MKAKIRMFLKNVGSTVTAEILSQVEPSESTIVLGLTK